MSVNPVLPQYNKRKRRYREVCQAGDCTRRAKDEISINASIYGLVRLKLFKMCIKLFQSSQTETNSNTNSKVVDNDTAIDKLQRMTDDAALIFEGIAFSDYYHMTTINENTPLERTFFIISTSPSYQNRFLILLERIYIIFKNLSKMITSVTKISGDEFLMVEVIKLLLYHRNNSFLKKSYIVVKAKICNNEHKNYEIKLINELECMMGIITK